MVLEKYSIGVGDRFGFQGVAQLRALQRAVEAVAVWRHDRVPGGALEDLVLLVETV